MVIVCAHDIIYPGKTNLTYCNIIFCIKYLNGIRHIQKQLPDFFLKLKVSIFNI